MDFHILDTETAYRCLLDAPDATVRQMIFRQTIFRQTIFRQTIFRQTIFRQELIEPFIVWCNILAETD